MEEKRESKNIYLFHHSKYILQNENNHEFLSSYFSIRGQFYLKGNGNCYMWLFIANEFNVFCKYFCEIWHAIYFCEY